MRKNILVAGIAAAALFPTFVMAQQTCEARSANRAIGTVAGAGVGALAGSAIAGRGDRTAGALIGGVAGALIGNQVAKGSTSANDCSRAYGYYDNNGVWHATNVSRNDARGYYDRQGAWVEGRPNGYYASNGQWVSANSDMQAAGYYDRDGHWVPASANGYYAANGQWVAGAASGYYDSRGRWVAGPATGYYDARGRWVSGQAPGRRDANGVWIADAQPGYYSNGRWIAGPSQGYYDGQGRWISTGTYSNASYTATDRQDFGTRVQRLEQRIRAGINDGSLDRREANRALTELSAIRRDEARMPHRRGELNARNAARMDERVDALSRSLRMDRRD